MNGRIYDPQLGRFFSADPIVQFPTFSQSYNRYSYVLNNPATYNDPSGHAIPAFAAAIIAWILAPTPDDVIVTAGVSTLLAKTYLESTGTTPGDVIDPSESPFDPDSQEPPDSAPQVDVPDTDIEKSESADELIPNQESPAEQRIEYPKPQLKDRVDSGKSPAQGSEGQSSQGDGESEADGDSEPQAIDGEGTPIDSNELIATGKVQSEPSTRRGNRGGTVEETEYTDSQGRLVTRQTIYNSNGKVIHDHYRPGLQKSNCHHRRHHMKIDSDA
jgi:hypothetical protein